MMSRSITASANTKTTRPPRSLLLLTFSQPLVRINGLRSYNRGDENVVHLGAPWLRVGATPGKRGLHALPRPPARQPIVSPGDSALHRTAVSSDSPAARARILACSRTRVRVGGQASGPYS